MKQRGTRRSCIEALAEHVPWRQLGFRAAIVFGSVARGDPSPGDVDVLLIPGEKPSLEAEVKVAELIEKLCGLEADIVTIDPGNPDCGLLYIALQEGKTVYIDDGDGSVTKMIMICYDFMLTKRKLAYTETLVEKVLANAP